MSAGVAETAEVAVAATLRRDLVGLVGLGVVTALALVGFCPAFGGVSAVVVGMVGWLVAAAVVLVARRRGWSRSVILVAVVVGYVVVGGAVAVPGAALGGVLPTPESVMTVLGRSVTGWKNLLVAEVPVGRSDLLVVPYLCGTLCGAIGAALSCGGGRRSSLAVVPSLLSFVAGVVLGTATPAFAVAGSTVHGLVVAIAALVWVAENERRRRAGQFEVAARPSWLSTVGVLVLAVVAGFLVGSTDLVGGGSNRTVLRDRFDPPDDVLDEPSPLQSYRRYRNDLRADVLFTARDLPAGVPVRLAALDVYDGETWRVATADDGGPTSDFGRVGGELPTDGRGTARTTTFTVGPAYSEVWLPTVGQVTAVDFDGSRAGELRRGFRFNRATATAVTRGGVRPGDVVAVSSVVGQVRDGAVPPASSGPPVPGPEPAATPEELATWVRSVSGGPLDPADPSGSLRRLRDRYLRPADASLSEAVLSDGRPDDPADAVKAAPGHAVQRLAEFIDVSTRGYLAGNDEQFASLLALVAGAELGVPARVVVGFRPTPGGDVELRGEALAAWVEIADPGAGWTTLLEVSPTKRERASETSRRDPAVYPVVAALPPPPTTLPPAGASSAKRIARPDEAGGPLLPRWLALTLLAVGGPLLVVAGVTSLVMWLKQRRRRRRRSEGPPSERIAAGWEEFLDLARDVGDVVPERVTRREAAVLLGRPGVAPLARSADDLVFGPGELGEVEVERYWSDVELTRAAVLGEMGPVQRWKANVSPNSLRTRADLRGGVDRVRAELAGLVGSARSAAGDAAARRRLRRTAS